MHYTQNMHYACTEKTCSKYHSETCICGRLHTKVRQVTKCVRFLKERGKGTYPTMLHALLRKARRDSPHKNIANVICLVFV